MSGPFWQPTDGQRRYYDRGTEQMGQAAQGATTWQQRARGDPAEALRQRHAELHGIGPTLHAASGQAAMGPATQDAATHQRALEIGLEMVRQEAELRAAQRVAPPQETVVPLQLPMGSGMQAAPAAVAGATQPDSNMADSSAGGGITGSPRTREESPPRAEEVVGDVAWNQRPLRVLVEEIRRKIHPPGIKPAFLRRLGPYVTKEELESIYQKIESVTRIFEKMLLFLFFFFQEK